MKKSASAIVGPTTAVEPIEFSTDNGLHGPQEKPKQFDNDDKKPQVYLSETFYIASKKHCVFTVRLTATGLSLQKESNGIVKEQLIHINDIIGCRCLRSKKTTGKKSGACACNSLGSQQLKVVEENSTDLDETDLSAYLYIYAYIAKKQKGKITGRERSTITLRFRSFDRYEDNNREAQKWRTKIKEMINSDCITIEGMEVPKANDDRKLLVLLNPKSGSGKAREMFQRRVSPLLVEAEIAYDLHVTKRANFAREFVRSRDVYSWRSILVVGGDGLYFEVINGLMERPDWDRALQELCVGIIPCGTGNGLARSIMHAFNQPYEPKPVQNAALSIIRGRIVPMDLVRVETKSEIMFSFLSVGWGLISDIDIESERLRAIGYSRFTIWSVHRLISLRTYKGKLSYKPIDPNQLKTYDCKREKNSNAGNMNNVAGRSYSTCNDCKSNDCDICASAFGDIISLETYSMENNGIYRSRLDSFYSVTSRKSAYFSTAQSDYQSAYDLRSVDSGSCTSSQAVMYGPSSTIPALPASLPDDWVVETGDFIMVHAAYQTHLGSDCYFAPSSFINDGVIWLMIIRAGISRSQLLSFLLGLSTGTHIPENEQEYIKFIPVTGFRIEPEPCDYGHLTVDGELVDYGPIQAEIFDGIAKVIVPSDT